MATRARSWHGASADTSFGTWRRDVSSRRRCRALLGERPLHQPVRGVVTRLRTTSRAAERDAVCGAAAEREDEATVVAGIRRHNGQRPVAIVEKDLHLEGSARRLLDAG